MLAVYMWRKIQTNERIKACHVAIQQNDLINRVTTLANKFTTHNS